MTESKLGPNWGGQWIGNLRGEYGGDYVADTEKRDGKWFTIIMLEDTIFSAIEQSLFTGVNAVVVGRTFIEGSILYGYTKSFTLASGAVQALKF